MHYISRLRPKIIHELDCTETRDDSGPGMSYKMCSFLVTIYNSNYSWHFTMLYFFFSFHEVTKNFQHITPSILIHVGAYRDWNLPLTHMGFTSHIRWGFAWHHRQEPPCTDCWHGTSGIASNAPRYWASQLMASADNPQWKMQSFISAVIHWSSLTRFAILFQCVGLLLVRKLFPKYPEKAKVIICSPSHRTALGVQCISEKWRDLKHSSSWHRSNHFST